SCRIFGTGHAHGSASAWRWKQQGGTRKLEPTLARRCAQAYHLPSSLIWRHLQQMSATSAILKANVRDLGGFEVRRLLPAFPRKMVGPFIFFDHMGPTRFPAGGGIDVRPHPHIGLATVTYLFEGVIVHRDSLGTVQRIEAGDVNWMTAGRGIVHSE